MPDFDEGVFDAMSDEELTDYLAHDAELPLSFVRSADAVLYAATVLAARQAASLPEAAGALESFRSDYLAVPFDGCTLWDDPPRFAPAMPAKAAPPAPRPAAPAPAKPKKQRAAKPKPRPAKPKPVPAPPPPPPIEARQAERPAQYYIPAPARPREHHFAAGLLVAALLVLLVGVGYLYLRTTFRAAIGGPSPAASAANAAGCTLTWVPDGYSAVQFTDWDVAGYLYTWQNDAGDKITFSRYAGGTKVAVDKSDAETSLVTVCGVQGEYTQKNGERSLVFSDAAGANVYYLDAKNVSDGDMQKMIAAIK